MSYLASEEVMTFLLVFSNDPINYYPAIEFNCTVKYIIYTGFHKPC